MGRSQLALAESNHAQGGTANQAPMFLFNIETSSKPKKNGIAAQRGKVGLQLGQGWLGKAREAIENGGKVGVSARGGTDRACEGRCRDAVHANQAWALYHRCVAHKKPQATADPVRCAGEAARAAGQGLQQQLHEVSDLCVEGGE